jgi:hypothetical protein
MKFIFLQYIKDSAEHSRVKVSIPLLPRHPMIEFFDENMNEMYITPKELIKGLKEGKIIKMTIEYDEKSSKEWEEKSTDEALEKK